MKQKQVKFLEALLREPTVTRSAQVAGITRSTAYSYLNDPSFKQELDKRRNECIEDAVRYLQGKLSVCVETLVSIIEDPDTAPQIKVNAITATSAFCKNLTEAEVLNRLQKLEKLAEGDFDS